MEKFMRFLREEDGLESVEYALMAAVIAIGILASVILVRDWIIAKFTAVSQIGPTS